MIYGIITPMHSALYYLLGLGAFALVAGSIITIVALRNAPEGYEDEEGFVGLTKGDEALLKEYATTHSFPTSHGSANLAA